MEQVQAWVREGCYCWSCLGEHRPSDAKGTSDYAHVFKAAGTFKVQKMFVEYFLVK